MISITGYCIPTTDKIQVYKINTPLTENHFDWLIRSSALSITRKSFS